MPKTEDVKARASEALARLRREHGPRYAFLRHDTPFQLLVAVALSAQTPDALVNQVTPALFAKYPSPERMARAREESILVIIRRVNFSPGKARRLREMARALVERHGGEVPRSLAELVELPGVGRKTAAVVQGLAWGEAESVAVDTHVLRVSYRLGLTREEAPDAVADDLARVVPRAEWPDVNFYLIAHGRSVCVARRPRCEACELADLCPKVGVTETAGGAARKAPTGKTPAGKAAGAKRRAAKG